MQLAAPSFLRVFLLLLAVGGVVYAAHFDNSFQFDDFHSIVQNPSIRGFEHWRSWFTDIRAFSVLPENLNYRPILLASYALSYRISGLQVWGFHLLNWLIHVAVCCLIYAVGTRLFSYGGAHPVRLAPFLGIYPPSAAGMALVAALLYLVHPVNSEPVNYISSRSESLATLFVLLAFLFYLERVRALTAGRGLRALALMLLSAAAFAAGLLTKEIAITFPALVLLHDLVLVRPGEQRRFPPTRVAFYTLLGGLALLYVIFREQLIPDSVAAARSAVGRGTYLLTQVRAWVHYLEEFIWPVRLTADNMDFGWSTTLRDPAVLHAALILIAVAASVKLGMRRHRLYAFGLIWFFLTLLPTSSIFPLAEPVNGHRAYLPAAGLSLAAVTLLFSLVSRPGRLGDLGRQGIVCAVLGAAAALLVPRTVERNQVWDSPRSLWADVVAKSPGNGRAHMNLGLALMEMGDLAGAGRHFDLAVERAPRYALAYVNRGILRHARADAPGAVVDFERALTLAPDNVFVLYWIGRIHAEAGNLSRAAEHLERAHAVSPRHVEALRLLLQVESRSGRAEHLALHLAALESLGVATDEDRQSVAYHLLLAGRHRDALPILEALVGRRPDEPRARFNLGFAYLSLGRHTEAEREFKRLLAGDSRNRAAWQNLLWVHKVSGDRAAYERTAAEMAAALGETAEAPQGAAAPRGAPPKAGSRGETPMHERSAVGPAPAPAPATRAGMRALLPAVLEVPALRGLANPGDTGAGAVADTGAASPRGAAGERR